MRALQEAGVFAKEPGLIWRCVWKSGATIVSSLRLRLETSSEHACHLRLIYFVRSSGGSPVAHDYPVSVVGATRPGRRGGTSFLCPVRTDGRSCLRRCQVLYCPSDREYFGCRQCHHLTAPRRRGRRPTVPADLATAVETAEQDVIHAASLAALLGAVRRLTAARACAAARLRAELAIQREVDALLAAAARSPRPASNKSLLQLWAKMRSVERQYLRDLRDLVSGGQEPEGLVLEVSPADRPE
jgi:hypothetical protein